ncbi:uncharacterized protein VTP21DRAFT_2980 [Calcarisporiella thermophila]|uniref:uncharacterized protein n=1 Tax=Calcarisporiella thermophila TaxID=911321 RepID=UPI0037430FF9
MTVSYRAIVLGTFFLVSVHAGSVTHDLALVPPLIQLESTQAPAKHMDHPPVEETAMVEARSNDIVVAATPAPLALFIKHPISVEPDSIRQPEMETASKMTYPLATTTLQSKATETNSMDDLQEQPTASINVLEAKETRFSVPPEQDIETIASSASTLEIASNTPIDSPTLYSFPSPVRTPSLKPILITLANYPVTTRVPPYYPIAIKQPNSGPTQTPAVPTYTLNNLRADSTPLLHPEVEEADSPEPEIASTGAPIRPSIAPFPERPRVFLDIPIHVTTIIHYKYEAPLPTNEQESGDGEESEPTSGSHPHSPYTEVVTVMGKTVLPSATIAGKLLQSHSSSNPQVTASGLNVFLGFILLLFIF